MIKKTDETKDGRKNQLKDHLSRLASSVVILNGFAVGGFVAL